MSTEEAPEQEQPLLRIVKGDPTPEEVAALVSVVSAMAAGAAEAASKQKRSPSRSGPRTTASCAGPTATARVRGAPTRR